MIDPGRALAEGRAAHEGLMVDQCTITRPGPGILDRATSTLTPGPSEILYTGKCRVKAQRMPRTAEAGEDLVIVSRYEIALPFSAVPSDTLRVGDRVAVTASADERLIGQELAVLAIDFGSTATAWRISAQDTTARR
ncbi:DUF6093 family protein [Kitasatospora sp. HPMI-4]|uniref:DUF6093 family protein n=1 Tax=Kitasatospora sp. HPMI-4 TaxID=3448443 RepID=UPI003F1B9BF1